MPFLTRGFPILSPSGVAVWRIRSRWTESKTTENRHMKETIDAQTLKKFNRWKAAGTWERIGIQFTTKQRDKLVKAGLAKAGLFGTIEER